jgi:hypothetical protein
MSFTVPVAADVTASTLEKFFNPKDPRKILQHIQNKPLLRILMESKQEFDAAGPAAGTTSPANFREPVQGALLRDQAGFYAGIAGADTLTFKSSDGAIQTTCPVRWMHAGWQISHEELMYQGVIVTNNNRDISPPTDDDQVKLFNALQLKKADYQESILYARNATLWGDGSQDAKAIPGLQSILTDDPTTGTTLGISRSQIWWRHVADTGVGGANAKLSYSKADQTLTERLNKVFNVVLPLYGGFVDPVAVAGSDLIDALIKELRAKGMNSVTGWNDKYTNASVTGVRFGRVDIEFDPTLDLLGMSKRIYAWDKAHLKLRPQTGQWGKVTAQNQPADQFVMLTSTTDRGVLTCNQMDCNYVGVMS